MTKMTKKMKFTYVELDAIEDALYDTLSDFERSDDTRAVLQREWRRFNAARRRIEQERYSVERAKPEPEPLPPTLPDPPIRVAPGTDDLGDDTWEVYGPSGTIAVFMGNFDEAQQDAQEFADKLNADMAL